jgi:replicative DNA helicase
MLTQEKDKKKAVEFTAATSKENLTTKIKSTSQLLEEQDQRLALYRGKEFIGLPQKTIPKLDELLLGLRKFIILAAAPNVGKTAITIQWGLDVLKNNDDVCLIYVSLEMSREDVIDRMRCHLTPMTYKNLYFGSQKDDGSQGWYTLNELESLANSKAELEKLAPRILILSEEDSPQISVTEIIQYIKDLKASSKCTKAIVIIDYLHVFPIEDKDFKNIHSDNEADKCRIGYMKRLRAELVTDPLIVIAEARKPNSSKDNWAATMADVSGSGRIGYGPDAGMLLNPILDDELEEKLGGQAKGPDIREFLANKGLRILRLTVDKGRDGMQKGDILLKYHFFENRFEETTWDEVCKNYNGILSEFPNMAAQPKEKPTNHHSKTIKAPSMDWMKKLAER